MRSSHLLSIDFIQTFSQLPACGIKNLAQLIPVRGGCWRAYSIPIRMLHTNRIKMDQTKYTNSFSKFVFVACFLFSKGKNAKKDKHVGNGVSCSCVLSGSFLFSSCRRKSYFRSPRSKAKSWSYSKWLFSSDAQRRHIPNFTPIRNSNLQPVQSGNRWHGGLSLYCVRTVFPCSASPLLSSYIFPPNCFCLL